MNSLINASWSFSLTSRSITWEAISSAMPESSPFIFSNALRRSISISFCALFFICAACARASSTIFVDMALALSVAVLITRSASWRTPESLASYSEQSSWASVFAFSASAYIWSISFCLDSIMLWTGKKRNFRATMKIAQVLSSTNSAVQKSTPMKLSNCPIQFTPLFRIIRKDECYRANRIRNAINNE